MVREKTFRPPQDLVTDLGEQVPLSEVRRLYSTLRKGDDDGLPELRWAYRILRQEGLLKACGGGEVDLPAFINLQLGPQVFVGVVEKCCQEVADSLINDGVPGTVAQYGENATVVFFSKDDAYTGELEKADHPVAIAELDLMVVEESRTKARSLAKSAGSDVVACDCFVIEAEPFGSLEFEELFLLKAVDPPPVSILKVDTSLGLVFGWAIISTISGVDYFDKQNEHIPDESMLEAATEFMIGDRTQGEMHIHDDDGIVKRGQIVFAWPMTKEIAEAFDIETDQTGLMIAAKPDDPKTLEKFADGTYTGFSIGGRRIPEHTEEVEA